MLPLHGVGSRQDLPLPFWLVLLGAGATLALTFLMLTRAWPTPRLAEPRGADLPRLTKLVDSKPWRWSLKALAIGITGLAGLALVAGQDRIDNPVFRICLCLGMGRIGPHLAAIWAGLAHCKPDPFTAAARFRPDRSAR